MSSQVLSEVEEYTKDCIKRKKESKYQDALHIGYDMLTVKYDGVERFILSKHLMDMQNCWQNLEAIKEVHWFKQMLYDMIRETDNKKELKQLAEDITQCEFELQRLWGFSEDATFHRFWEAPKCICPKIDNGEAIGTPYTIIALSCPLHGSR